MDDITATKPHHWCSPINIRFELGNGVEKALTLNGLTVNDLVLQAFVEVGNRANGFAVALQAFEMKANNRSLWFDVSSYPRLDQNEVCLHIALGKDPNKLGSTMERLDELFGDWFSEPTTRTRH